MGGSGRPPSLVLPIFPLAEVTLFPGTLLPLHVFEARYRAMVTDALARDRRLAMALLEPGFEPHYDGKPPVRPVAGAGEIVNCERLASGRFNILLRGFARVMIEREVPSDTLYRIVSARRLDDAPGSPDAAPVVARIRAACLDLLAALGRPGDLLDEALAPDQAPGAVADRVAAAVIADGRLRQSLLEDLDAARRAERVAGAVEALVKEIRGGRA
jgi:Lon protease-like protein